MSALRVAQYDDATEDFVNELKPQSLKYLIDTEPKDDIMETADSVDEQTVPTVGDGFAGDPLDINVQMMIRMLLTLYQFLTVKTLS